MKKALIIIPTFNESQNLLDLIPKIFDVTANNRFAVDYHILIVDDNSTDGTARIAKNFAQQYPVFLVERERKLGLGTAYVAGFKWALARDYQYVYEMDADWSHKPEYLVSFIEKIEDEKAFCVIGSRFCNQEAKVVNWDWKRHVLTTGGYYYTRFILGDMGVRDKTSGFKCFTREALERLDLDAIQSNGFIFQLELNYRLYKKGLKLSEIPIVFEDRVHGASKMSFSIIWEALWRPLKWRLRLE